MKKMKNFASFSVLWVLFFVLILVPIDAKEEAQVRFQVLPERTKLFPAEPFRVTLILTNESKESIKLHPFDPYLRGAIMLKPPHADWIKFYPFLSGIPSVVKKILTIAPNQSYRHQLRLDIISGGGFTMIQPGTWTFFFNINLKRPVKTVSASVTVEVLQLPPHEQEALEEFLKIPGIEAIMHYLHAEAAGNKAKEALGAFAHKYKDTRYGNYAQFCIAKSMLPIPEWDEKDLKWAKPVEALPIFLRLSVLPSQEFSLVGDSLYYLAVCHYWLGKKEQAQKLLEELVRRFPDHVWKGDAEKVLSIIKGK